MAFDKTISIGNILTIMTMLILASSSFFHLQYQVTANATDIEENKAVLKAMQTDIQQIGRLLTRIDTNQEYIRLELTSLRGEHNGKHQ